MERKGYRQVWIPKELYDEFQAQLDAQQKGSAMAQKPASQGRCGAVMVPGTEGGVKFNCSGGCGFIDRFLGRSCKKIVTGNPGDDGLQVFCACSGGWFDRVFG